MSSAPDHQYWLLSWERRFLSTVGTINALKKEAEATPKSDNASRRISKKLLALETALKALSGGCST